MFPLFQREGRGTITPATARSHRQTRWHQPWWLWTDLWMKNSRDALINNPVFWAKPIQPFAAPSQDSTWFWGTSLLCPPLSGKVIMLFFFFLKTVSETSLVPVYRGRISATSVAYQVSRLHKDIWTIFQIAKFINLGISLMFLAISWKQNSTACFCSPCW